MDKLNPATIGNFIKDLKPPTMKTELIVITEAQLKRAILQGLKNQDLEYNGLSPYEAQANDIVSKVKDRAINKEGATVRVDVTQEVNKMADLINASFPPAPFGLSSHEWSIIRKSIKDGLNKYFEVEKINK